MFIDFAEAKETETAIASADQGLLAALGLNGSLFIFQLINFAVVAAVIWWLILKPLTKKMSERQKLIDESIDNAKKIQETLTRGEQKYQERVDQAKVEANKILERATKESEQLGRALKDQTKAEIEAQITQAKRGLTIDRAQMMTEIKQHAAELVVLALGKILPEKLDSKKDQQFIEDMVAKLKL